MKVDPKKAHAYVLKHDLTVGTYVDAIGRCCVVGAFLASDEKLYRESRSSLIARLTDALRTKGLMDYSETVITWSDRIIREDPINSRKTILKFLRELKPFSI